MINPEQIASQAKSIIAANPRFRGITPELDTIISAIALATATAANIEIEAFKAQHNVHFHANAAGPTTPPTIPIV